jgi:L-seryl-tRNA(Ser) seleniumtransferase
MPKEQSDRLSGIPSVEKIRKTPPIVELLEHYSDGFVTGIVREVLEEVRKRARSRQADADLPRPDEVAATVVERVRARLDPSLKRVINGTGVVIHTNLGRSLLGPQVLSAMADAGAHYCNLEIDLGTGARGHRDSVIEPLLCELTGAEAATVVNNNAAAVMLCLDTLAKGGEVIVSRGELVEIGGSFRIPDVMEKSGAQLVSVGTTNRTYISDYERALSPNTALLLKVHHSNYHIVGFTNDVGIDELAELGRRRGIPVMQDLGSGALVDVTKYGMSGEPMPRTSIETGADVVTFSGDKLLGGPQAGIILGKCEHIMAIRKNPLMRALRVDKLTLSSLGALFRVLLSSREPEQEIPTLALLARPLDEIHAMATKVLDGLTAKACAALRAEIADGESAPGGGSCPGQTLPTKLLVLKPANISPDKLAARLRAGSPPIVGIIRNDSFCLDFRTIQPDEIPEIITVLRGIAPPEKRRP